MSRSETSTRAFWLSLIGGILILSNTALLGVATRWFPGIIPTLPSDTGAANDPAVLYKLTAAGLIFGALVLLGALLLRSHPASKKRWGILIIMFSIPSVVTGGGFVIGFILGIIGGVSALSRKPGMQATKVDSQPARRTER